MYARALSPGLSAVFCLGLLSASPAIADDLLLPEGKAAEPITAPTARVTVRADGVMVHLGEAYPASTDIVLAELSAQLRGWHAGTTNGVLLVAGDRRADFRSVRATLATANHAGIGEVGFLAGPESQPPRAIRLSQSVSQFDPLGPDAPAGVPALVPLTLHLQAGGLEYVRMAPASVSIPNINGALDLTRLGLLLDEDRRLHPAARLVILNTDDGVPYAETFAALDLTREKGYTGTLLAGGPASVPTTNAAPARPSATITVETPTSVVLRPSGDIDLRAPDGSLELIHASAIRGYEAWCDPTTCDIVAATSGRRVFLGSRERNTPFPDVLFALPVTTREGRLGLQAPLGENVYSPIRQVPGWDIPDPPAGTPPRAFDPIVLGSIDKSLIDAVIKKNMKRVQRCYAEALGRDGSLTGKVTVKFVISIDGSVSRATIKSSAIEDPEMLECMTSTFSTFVFPAPKGGIVIVSYPFLFTPG